MNATLEKFGYPHNLIKQYDQWSVLLRLPQVTLGALILGFNGDYKALSQVPQVAFTELQRVISDIEQVLHSLLQYDKINYLMLMMVDPHVHFHVVPRYAQAHSFDGLSFTDYGWPGPPALGQDTPISADTAQRLIDRLRSQWQLIAQA